MFFYLWDLVNQQFFCLLQLNETLKDQRIDNFYYENETFYIRVYVRNQGHKYLTNKISKFIYLGDEKADSNRPTSFIQHLRKYLKNGFIRAVEQIEGERILKITIESKTGDKIEKFFLYLEIFAGGNIILTDSKNKIKNS